MSTTVQIGGEAHTLQDFMAFKSLTAMRLVADVEEAFREVLKVGAEFRRQFEADNYVSIPRAEARRQMRPLPLARQVQRQLEDGTIELSEGPILDEHGQAVLGPDPLGHLTEQDWAAAGNVLRVPDTPPKELEMAAMLPKGFQLARKQVLRILALVITSNRDLEQWDTAAEDIDAKLDAAAAKLLHDARLDELIRLGIAAMNVCREQVADPFEEAKSAWAAWQATKTTPEPEPEAPAPAVFESATDGPSTSSTSSPDNSDGTPSPPSTEPAGISS